MVQGGRYTNITAMSAYKHGFDMDYNGSGTPVFTTKSALTCNGIYVDEIVNV